ncbi:MAG: glycerol-3-phosphate 1-O-acyltransferase PlsY, partial [Gammaproteobacteria bacterium]|nr:glycerol-3-phosphate 1-O-acyltransferase PlsY [Gammaproteobacteria bacterium]
MIAFAYLLGSVSAAIIVCKLMGLPDPRSQGSGNPGATNVLRVGGKGPAAITLLVDTLKGFIPVLAAKYMGMSPLLVGLVGLAAFFGHLFPVFFGFKGGKGVATMLGVLFGLNLLVGAATGLTWLLIAKVFKLSSLSALIATALAPFYIFFLTPYPEWLPIISFMTLVLFWRHKSNIQNILSGKEGK